MNKILNTKKSVIVSMLLKCYQILMPFIFRTIIIYSLGEVYNGLGGLFTSVFQMLNMAELGIGSALVFCMYRPIAEGDEDKICALMMLLKKCYRIIGIVVFSVGLILTPFIPKLIKGTVPEDINIYLLYLLNLFSTVISYWLFAYKNSILKAHQRMDLISGVSILSDTLKYGLQMIALLALHSYYYYIVSVIVGQIVFNFITAAIADRLYPKFKARGSVSKEERVAIANQVKDLFLSKIGWIVGNSADSIVISAFMGLVPLSLYQNYFYIVNAVLGFMTVLKNSVLAGIGNSLVVKSNEENYREFCTFSFIEMWIISNCVCCFATLFQPFMRLWVTEARMLPYSIVVLLCLQFFVYEYVMMLNTYRDAAGMWHSDRFRPLIGGLCNLTINIILVGRIGLQGVILSTILSMAVIDGPWLIKNLFSSIFTMDKMASFIKMTLLFVVETLLAAVVSVKVCSLWNGNGIINLLCIGVTAVALSNGIFLLFFRKHPVFADSLVIIKRLLSRSK